MTLTAGLSLGEFTALAAAGALAFDDGIRVVRQRGQFMQQAGESTRGAWLRLSALTNRPLVKFALKPGSNWRISIVPAKSSFPAKQINGEGL